jgi:transposase
MSTLMRRASSNQFVEVRAERLEGAPISERRRWSDDFKDEAVAASLGTDVNISALARSLDISPSQLFGWRRAAARQATMVAQKTAVEATSDDARRVEIEVGDAVLRIPSDIAEDDLRRLLRAVRQA